MGMLQSEGPVNWEVARQVAAWVALDGAAERPVDPGAHEAFDELVRAAQTHVVAETGLTASFRAPLQTVGPKAWAELHLDALKPVLEALAANLGEVMRGAGRNRATRRSARRRCPGCPARAPTRSRACSACWRRCSSG